MSLKALELWYSIVIQLKYKICVFLNEFFDFGVQNGAYYHSVVLQRCLLTQTR